MPRHLRPFAGPVGGGAISKGGGGGTRGRLSTVPKLQKNLQKNTRKGKAALKEIQSGAKGTSKAFGARERQIKSLLAKEQQRKGAREELRRRLMEAESRQGLKR